VDGTPITESEGTDPLSSEAFSERFRAREQAEKYRDRFAHGRHARVDRLERAALRELLSRLEHVPTAMDIPCGTGRLSTMLSDVADRVILADGSAAMLDVARGYAAELDAEYVETRCESIARPDKSVGLIFCHRFLHHLKRRSERLEVLREFARVAYRYVILNHYPSGMRTRAKRLLRALVRGTTDDDRIASAAQLVSEAGEVGLQLVSIVHIRRFPVSGCFLLFRAAARFKSRPGQVGANRNRPRIQGEM
jgi:SAM-dependent methyltransferase